MTRVRKLALDEWDPELRAMARADSATPLEQGLTRIFAHSPEVTKGMMAFAGSLKIHRELPERLVELVRLRIAFHNQCRSCMAIRYEDAVADGVTEELVCSLEAPMQAEALSDAEKAAIRYGELMATNHLAIDDDVYGQLAQHFTEKQIVELGMTVAFFIGFGRLAASLHMVEELPGAFQEGADTITPWGEASVRVR